MKYSVVDRAGKVIEQGEGDLVLDTTAVTLQSRSGRLALKLTDIDRVDAEDYRLVLTSYTGDCVQISHLAQAYEQHVEKLTEFRNAALIHDLMMGGEDPIDHFGAAVYRALWTGRPPQRGRVYLFHDHLTIVGNAFDPFIVPFSDVESFVPNADTYSVELMDDENERIVIHKLGLRYEEFVRKVQDGLRELDDRTKRAVARLLGGRTLPGFKDGCGVKEERVSKEDWKRLEDAAIREPDLRESYLSLRSLSGRGQTWIAVKELRRPSEGEDPASCYLCWFFVRLKDTFVAHEIVSETDHATYLYRVSEADRDVRRLNRALRHLNFRREPIYAADEEITSGRLTQYRVALRKLDYLRWTRQAFAGRAIHTSADAWRAAIQKVLRGA